MHVFITQRKPKKCNLAKDNQNSEFGTKHRESLFRFARINFSVPTNSEECLKKYFPFFFIFLLFFVKE